MSTHTLRIDGMHDETCEDRVRAALGSVEGVATDAVRIGGATIRCEPPGELSAACAAITAAGFRVWEARAPGDRFRGKYGARAAPPDGAAPPG